MTHIRNLSYEDILNIRDKAFDSDDKELLFNFLKAPCSRLSFKSGSKKWEKTKGFRTYKGFLTCFPIGEKYTYSLAKHNNLIYIVVREATGTNWYRYSFSKEDALKLNIIS